MSIELFNHVSHVYSDYHYEFTVMDNETVIMWGCQLDYHQDGYTGECTFNGVNKEEITSFPYTPNEPMKLPKGWLAQHPVTKAFRCHKHRRNACKWMQQSHSDFMQCRDYWIKQTKGSALCDWFMNKPDSNTPEFTAWCDAMPQTNFPPYYVNIFKSPAF